VVDPTPDDIIDTPPAIGFTVSTAKFAGQVTVLYDRGLDTYSVELHCNGELVKRCNEVYFDDLGQVLADLIDDGSWQQIAVEVVSVKKTRQRKAA